MAKIEIDEDDYKRLSTLGTIANQIYQHPKGRLMLEEAQKLVQPNAPTPALDAVNAQQAPLEEVNKKLEALTDMMSKDKAERETQAKVDQVGRMQEESFAKLRTNSGYTDAGIDAVKKIMSEKGILNPIDAAILWERYEPQATIATPTGSNSVPLIEKLQTNTDETFKQLFESRGENPAALDKLIKGALDDFRGR
jgi:hypothetical protein